MDMFFYVLSEDPPYSDVEEFMGDVDSLLTILTSRPELENARVLVNQLWMGEMTWREFVEDFMHIYLQQVKEASSKTSERKGNLGQPEFLFVLLILDVLQTRRMCLILWKGVWSSKDMFAGTTRMGIDAHGIKKIPFCGKP